jgi:hypothetical protein
MYSEMICLKKFIEIFGQNSKFIKQGKKDFELLETENKRVNFRRLSKPSRGSFDQFWHWQGCWPSGRRRAHARHPA